MKHDQFAKLNEQVKSNVKANVKAMNSMFEQNKEALQQTQKISLEVCQSIAKMNSDYVQQTVDELKGLSKTNISASIKNGKVAEPLQKTLHRTKRHSQKVNQVLQNSAENISNIFRNRVEAIKPGKLKPIWSGPVQEQWARWAHQMKTQHAAASK